MHGVLKHITLPLEPLFILHTLQTHGYEAYIVGGAIRDVLLATLTSDTPSATDFDFATNASPQQIAKIFPDSFCENDFGTVSIAQKHIHGMLGITPAVTTLSQPSMTRIIDVAQASKLHASLVPASSANIPKIGTSSEEIYEITPFRVKEVYEDDNRHPSSFSWGDSIHDDLLRRDFTINALAMKVDASFLKNLFENEPNNSDLQPVALPGSAFEVIDDHAGWQDLQAGIIRTVGNPADRFQEDALRMLRAIRFSVQLNMSIADTTYQAIQDLAHLLATISQERIRDEFLKIILSEYPKEGIELLADTGLLTHIMPELLECKGVKQGGHHTTDVWVHSLDAVAECPSLDPVVRLATLLHDIGKPVTYAIRDKTITFYNHEIVGAKIAASIARRFHMSKKDIQRIYTLVRHHMFYYQPHNTDSAIRRFMRKVGLENIDDILQLREADRLGSGAKKTSWRLEEMKQRMIQQLHQPFAITDLAIDGHDLMNEYNLKPGPVIGQILQELFEEVLEHPESNTPDELLKKAKEILEKRKAT